MAVQETWLSVLSEFAFWLWAEMDPTNREYLTSQAIRGSWIVGCGYSPGKHYQRIWTCLLGEVESYFSPIRRQASDVKYPEKVERRSGRMAAVRHPDKSGISWTEFLPGWNELWFPSGWNELWFHASKGGCLCVQERGSQVAIFGEDPTPMTASSFRFPPQVAMTVFLANFASWTVHLLVYSLIVF